MKIAFIAAKLAFIGMLVLASYFVFRDYEHGREPEVFHGQTYEVEYTGWP